MRLAVALIQIVFLSSFAASASDTLLVVQENSWIPRLADATYTISREGIGKDAHYTIRRQQGNSKREKPLSAVELDRLSTQLFKLGLDEEARTKTRSCDSGVLLDFVSLHQRFSMCKGNFRAYFSTESLLKRVLEY